MAYMRFYSGSYKNYIHDNATYKNSLYISNKNTAATGDSDPNTIGSGDGSDDYGTNEQVLLAFTTNNDSATTIPLLTFKNILPSNTSIQSTTSTASRYYQVDRTVEGKLVVNVPWNDTVYDHPTYTPYTNGLYKITVDNLGHVSAATAVSKSDITNLGIPTSDTWRPITIDYNDTNSVHQDISISNNNLKIKSGNIIDFGITTADNTTTVQINHATQGISDSTWSPGYTGSSTTLAAGGTFKLPIIEYDQYGHITSSIDSITMKLPAAITLPEHGSKAQLNETIPSRDMKLWSPAVLKTWIDDILGVNTSAVSTIAAISSTMKDDNAATGIINYINTKADIVHHHNMWAEESLSQVQNYHTTLGFGKTYHIYSEDGQMGSNSPIDSIIGSFEFPTETTLTTSSSGSGNVVTDISVNNHAITVTKGNTFSLDGHTHSIVVTGATIGTAEANDRIIQLNHGEKYEIGLSNSTNADKAFIAIPTETSLASTSSGSGNAVTTISVSGHAITLIKGKTFSESNHAHPVTLAASGTTDENVVNLGHNERYKLTVGSDSSTTHVIFKTPTETQLSITTTKPDGVTNVNGISDISVDGHAITVTKNNFVNQSDFNALLARVSALEDALKYI